MFQFLNNLCGLSWDSLQYVFVSLELGGLCHVPMTRPVQIPQVQHPDIRHSNMQDLLQKQVRGTKQGFGGGLEYSILTDPHQFNAS